MGLSEMLQRTWLTKTKTKNELEISTIIEDCAGSISPFAGKNTIGMSVHGLQYFENKLLDLTEELFTDFSIDQSAFDREKVILKTQIQSQQDKPSVLCVQQFNRKMFPHHPISFDTMGTEQTLSNVTPAAATKLFQKSLREKNMQLCVVGDYDEKKWIKVTERIEKLFANGEAGRLKPEFAVEPLKKREVFFIEKDKEQSHVIVGWHALNLSDPDRYVLQVIQAVMAGQGGRLFMELRDKNSLAYSVSPIKMESLETGYFGGYIACSPEKVEKSIELFDLEFEKICNEKIPQIELQRAQKYLIGQHDIGLQRKSSICSLISFDNFYGNDFHESLNVAQEYSKITIDDVQRVARSIFTKPSVISVVGKKV
jgi:zinc protease